MECLTGIIFSDLGQASRFMALEWVQELLMQRLGYHPFPATLNVRPEGAKDAETWQRIRRDCPGTPLTEASAGHCGARLYRVEISKPNNIEAKIAAAVLLPEVSDYPPNKIEIVAPMRLKDHFALADGDQLILEFSH